MRYTKTLVVAVVCILSVLISLIPSTIQAQTSESGSVGIEGRISAPPPQTGATITVPSNGQSFSETPVTVAGICSGDVLVKLFKNGVFAGATQCSGGSFSIQIDLFSGQNELVARVFDELDQAGPDSNTVTVTFNDGRPGAESRVSLTSNFAKRGANPGDTLRWPIILSGGQGPYAITVDWGDGSQDSIISRGAAGTFNIEHIYENPGVYNIIVKAVDANDTIAYLQLVGVANGPLSQDNVAAGGDSQKETMILWQPAAIMIPLIVSTFWLGQKYELKKIRQHLEHGERPF